jgi:hypothetical protein
MTTYSEYFSEIDNDNVDNCGKGPEADMYRELNTMGIHLGRDGYQLDDQSSKKTVLALDDESIYEAILYRVGARDIGFLYQTLWAYLVANGEDIPALKRKRYAAQRREARGLLRINKLLRGPIVRHEAVKNKRIALRIQDIIDKFKDKFAKEDADTRRLLSVFAVADKGTLSLRPSTNPKAALRR